MDELTIGDEARCRWCHGALVVAEVHTGLTRPGFQWVRRWVHVNRSALGGDAERCWAPLADPVPATIVHYTDPLHMPAFGRNL